MKNFLLFIALPVILVGGVIYWLIASKKITNPFGNTQTAGTPANTFSGWASFLSAQQTNTTGAINTVHSGLSALSNIFGTNDGGNNPGVSISGSGVSGVASSGSGTGALGAPGYSPGVDSSLDFGLSTNDLYSNGATASNFLTDTSSPDDSDFWND